MIMMTTVVTVIIIVILSMCSGRQGAGIGLPAGLLTHKEKMYGGSETKTVNGGGNQRNDYIYILLKMGGEREWCICVKRGNKRESAWIIRVWCSFTLS